MMCYLCFLVHVGDFHSTDNCTDGNITLYDGANPNEGLLLICANRAWTSVCYNSYWSEQDSRVACTQLGYTIYGMFTMLYVFYITLIHMADCTCTALYMLL